jgi:DNA-binding beta-propeller fold protein YncE
MRLGLRVPVAAVALLALAGCATVERQPTAERVWPGPPDLARIRFVRIVQDQGDLTRRGFGALTDALVGEGPAWPLSQPMGIAPSPDGKRLYVTNYSDPGLFLVDFESGRMSPFGSGRELQSALGVAVDGQGLVYVADPLARCIHVFDASGRPTRTIVHPSLERPTGIAVDPERGRLYVADSASRNSLNHRILIFDLHGTSVGAFGERGSGEGQFLFPTYVAVDGDGRVYVTDSLNGRVQVFDPDGRHLRTLGQRGDAVGMFDKPKGVALDTFGNVYVVDSAWSNVQIFNRRGNVLLFFGGRGHEPGLLFNPTGIAIDRNNRIYVADAFNARIAIYQLVNTTAADGDATHRQDAGASRRSGPGQAPAALRQPEGR